MFMQLGLKANDKPASRMAGEFIASSEEIKAVYEQSAKKSGGSRTRAYILTSLKIIYIEISAVDAFLKCYPLNKKMTYQVEGDKPQNNFAEGIFKAKIQAAPDASLIFSLDKDRDESDYFTSIKQERQAAHNFIIQLNGLLARM